MSVGRGLASTRPHRRSWLLGAHSNRPYLWRNTADLSGLACCTSPQLFASAFLVGPSVTAVHSGTAMPAARSSCYATADSTMCHLTAFTP